MLKYDIGDSMKFENIFFDWNGTLYDDAMASVLAVNDMLARRNIPPITLEQYRDMIEIPIVRFYDKVMDMSKENMDDVSEEFDELYRSNLQDCPVAQSARETLETLSRLGVKMYIFSSSACDIIEPHLKRWGLDHYFQTVLGASDRYVTGKVMRTAEYIKNHGIQPEKTLFVGDMLHDCEVADHVGSCCVLVSYGHQSKQALLSTGRPVVEDLLCVCDIAVNGIEH